MVKRNALLKISSIKSQSTFVNSTQDNNSQNIILGPQHNLVEHSEQPIYQSQTNMFNDNPNTTPVDDRTPLQKETDDLKKQLRKKITNAAVYILVTISDFNTKYTCKLCNHCAAYPSVGRIADHTNVCRNTHYEKALEI